MDVFGVIRMDGIRLEWVKDFQQPHTWLMQALWFGFQRVLVWHVGFMRVPASLCVRTVHDGGVSSGGKWMIALPNIDPMRLFMPFSEKVFEVSLSPSDLTCGLYLHQNTSQIYWLLWNGCKHGPLCHLSQAIWLSLECHCFTGVSRGI